MRISLGIILIVAMLATTAHLGISAAAVDATALRPPISAPEGSFAVHLPEWFRLIPPFVLAFVFLFVVFRPLEWAFPAKSGQRVFRPHWFTDLCFFLGQYLIWNGLVLSLLLSCGGWLHVVVPASFRAAVAGQAWWAQAIEVVLLSDFFVYWGHRLQHANAFLWRFHSIHHTAEHLDWLAAHREHPLDTVYTVGLINLPVFLLGFPASTLMTFILFRGIWAIYIHSNVRLPIGPVRWFIGAPELHHWHHDRDRRAGNYANISPLMDILFGTYRCPDHEPESFGVMEPSAKNYVGHMIRPFLPQPSAEEAEQDAAPGIPVVTAPHVAARSDVALAENSLQAGPLSINDLSQATTAGVAGA